MYDIKDSGNQSPPNCTKINQSILLPAYKFVVTLFCLFNFNPIFLLARHLFDFSLFGYNSYVMYKHCYLSPLVLSDWLCDWHSAPTVSKLPFWAILIILRVSFTILAIFQEVFIFIHAFISLPRFIESNTFWKSTITVSMSNVLFSQTLTIDRLCITYENTLLKKAYRFSTKNSSHTKSYCQHSQTVRSYIDRWKIKIRK